MRYRSWLLACTMLGCGPMVLPGDGDGSASEGSGTGPTSATTSPTSVTTTTATSGPPPTSATLGSDGGSDDVLDDDGALPWDCGAAPPGTEHHCIGIPTCDPPPMPGVVAWISVDGGELPIDPVPEPYSYACTIASQAASEALLELELECADGPHTLAIGTSVGIAFDATGDFVLSVIYSNDTFAAEDQLVTLRTSGGALVLAGMSSPWRPDDGAVPADFFDPLDVTLLENVCPVEPPAGGDFLEPCFSIERQALRFSAGRQSVEVYDHGVDELASFVLLVEHAEQLHDITCTDISDTWYAWVAVPPILD